MAAQVSKAARATLRKLRVARCAMKRAVRYISRRDITDLRTCAPGCATFAAGGWSKVQKSSLSLTTDPPIEGFFNTDGNFRGQVVRKLRDAFQQVIENIVILLPERAGE